MYPAGRHQLSATPIIKASADPSIRIISYRRDVWPTMLSCCTIPSLSPTKYRTYTGWDSPQPPGCPQWCNKSLLIFNTHFTGIFADLRIPGPVCRGGHGLTWTRFASQLCGVITARGFQAIVPRAFPPQPAPWMCGVRFLGKLPEACQVQSSFERLSHDKLWPTADKYVARADVWKR